MPRSPEEQRIYMREYVKRPEVKSKRAAYQKDYYLRKTKLDVEFRRNLLSQFSCISCGEANPYAIDWHHVDPSEKLFPINDVTRSHDSWWDEVLKCVPVCANCHRKIHNSQLCLIPPKIR